MDFVKGSTVLISSTPWYHGLTGKHKKAPRSYANRTAVVLGGGPDRDGDIPLRIKGVFYADQLAPDCLTVLDLPLQDVSEGI